MGKVHPDGHSLATLPNGLDVSIVSSLDLEFLYKEIYEQRTYLQHGVELHEGSVVLDIGANIGLFSIFAAGIAGRQGHVIALEPVERLFDALQHNVQAHAEWSAQQGAAAAQVSAINAGAGDGCRSSATFTTYSNFSCWSTMYPQGEEFHQAHIAEYVRRNIAELTGMPPSLYNRAARFFWHWVPSALFSWSMRRYVRNNLLVAGQERCELWSVSEVVRAQRLERIDLMKVDVEGAELDVLRGVEAAHWPRFRQVVVEVESYAAPSGDASTPEVEEVQRILSGAGFASIVVDEPLKGSGVVQVYARRNGVVH